MNKEEVFSQLGFNTLEAEVYISLLKNGPQTAYKVGKLINRPTANVYKAVEILFAAGAVEIEENETRVCKAIPVKTLVAQLETAYKNKLTRAAAVLNTIEEEVKQEGIYNLASVDAVIQRAKEMLRRCKQVAVLDIFPEPLNLLKEDIKKLAAQGKDVMLEAYAEIVLEKVSIVIPEVSEQTKKYWKAQQLNISIDGKETLVALFNHDMSELIQANYTNNLYLSCILYAGMRSEHQLLVLSKARSIKEMEQIKSSFKFFHNSKVPGPELLFKLYKK